MFGFFKRKPVVDQNQIVVDYDPTSKHVLLIRTNGLTNNEVIDGLKDAVRCMGGKVKKRRRK